MPSRELLGLLWQEVALARDDANPRLSLQGLACRRYQGRLYLVAPDLAPARRCCPSGWKRRSPCRTGSGSSGSGERMAKGCGHRGDEPLSVRFQVAPGVMLKPVGRVGSRRLKKLLQVRVPSWQRGRIPILYYGEQVALVAGLFVCDGFLAPEEGWRGSGGPRHPGCRLTSQSDRGPGGRVMPYSGRPEPPAFLRA
jgi:tRNA(Ile)-lysidine synthase